MAVWKSHVKSSNVGSHTNTHQEGETLVSHYRNVQRLAKVETASGVGCSHDDND